MNRLRWTLGLAAPIVVIFAAVWFGHRPGEIAQKPAQPAVALATARLGTIDVTVSAVGRFGAGSGTQSRLAFAVSGRLASIFVRVGDRVAAGRALASLDATTYALANRQADADAAAARAQARAAAVDRTSTRLAVDRAALARERRLYAAGVAARKDVDAANAQLAADGADASGAAANIAVARAQFESANAHAALTAQDESNTILRAPAAGIVTAIYHNVGESVDPSVPVIGLAPGGTGTITLDVAGSDLASIADGDLVRLRIQGSQTALVGRVVGVAGAIDPTTQSAQVLVETDARWALGGSAVTAEIVVRRDRGILIPEQAIVADPQSGKTLVFFATHNGDGSIAFEQREIHVLFSNATQAEVGGIRAGERIASRGAFELLAPTTGGN